ncbi:hypothetical protein MAUB_58880 [Mycolicibacterium aubagnense]|uniref:Uncharacterized protein n=1 Tax=Mycolicibacterium aubagnense TaxID=319707 RepID=A0ABM7IMJ7_9MYCO|nr:hypothetical protein MAUB_58880 [Mycolicibacterium aubagnense]
MGTVTDHAIMPTALAAADQEYEVRFVRAVRDGKAVSGRWFGGRSASGHWLVQRPDGGQTISGVPDDEIVVTGCVVETD